MLSTEHQITLRGYSLFRDLTDRRRYYYLPKSKVNIANNGKKMNFAAFVSSKIKEVKEATLNTSDLTSGYLTMEVELDFPSDNDLKEMRKELPTAIDELIEKKKQNGEIVSPEDEISITEKDFVLTPVSFKDGEVKLFILGEDGTSEKSLAKVKIVGSQKPSLYDKENAVFSMRLGATETEIMYNLLTQGGKGQKPNESSSFINSQLAVMYDLTFKGIEPAHYVKITVDFNATEDFWNHHFEFDGDFKYGKKNNQPTTGKDNYNISVVAAVDVDAMFRELINKGAIVVQQIDYSGENAGAPLNATDPSAIELVKKLLSNEFFTPTPLPNESYSALDRLGKVAADGIQKPDKDKPEGEKAEEQETNEQQTGEQKQEEQKETAEDETSSNSNETEDEKKTEEKDKEKKDEISKVSSVSSANWSLDAKIGYAYKKRNLKETLKRTYIFNKQAAVNQTIHPCGMITFEGTDFDASKQVYLGRLGDSVFREHEVTFSSGLDFEKYNLKSIEVGVKLLGTTGTHFSLTKEKPSCTFKFNSETFGISDDDNGKLKYKANFIFDTTKLIGFDLQSQKETESKDAYTSTSEKAIVISAEHFDKSVRPLNIMTGSLSETNIDSTIVSLYAADGEGNDKHKTRVFNEKVKGSDTDHFILLNANKAYEAQIQYNFTNNIPTSSKRLVVSSKDFKEGQLVIEDPTSGMIKICTADGAETFKKVRSIDVSLKKGNNTAQLVQLRQSACERYLIVDNVLGDEEKIKVESVKVNYREGEKDKQPFEAPQKEFPLDTSEIVLDI